MFGKSKAKLLEEQLTILQEELLLSKRNLQEYQTLFHSYIKQQKTNGYIIHVSPNGVILNSSGSVYHVLGYTIDQLKGKRLSEITTSDDKKKVQNHLCRELSYKGKIKRIAIDKKIKNVESFAYVLKDDASILFNEWDISDISGNTKTNFFYLLNAIPEMAYIKDSENTYVVVNEQFANACNKKPEYFENKSKLNDLLFKNLFSNDKYIQNNTNEILEFELEWPDGEIRNVSCECKAISNISNLNSDFYIQPFYLHIIKNIEKAKVNKGVCGAHFRCSYIDKKFEITYKTNNFVEIFENNDFVKSIHKEDIEMFYYSLNKITQNTHPWRWQGRIVINNQYKRINIIAWPIQSELNLEMLGMIQDLTNEIYEKKINMLLMKHINDVVALHCFQDGIKSVMKVYSQSIHSLLGYENIENDMFWKLHPDDCLIIQEVLYKMKRCIADTAFYRIKHKDNYWVKVKTEFIPFDNEFITITSTI